MVRQIKVAFHPLVIDFLEQLTFALYEKGYFGFYDADKGYNNPCNPFKIRVIYLL